MHTEVNLTQSSQDIQEKWIGTVKMAKKDLHFNPTLRQEINATRKSLDGNHMRKLNFSESMPIKKRKTTLVNVKDNVT